MKVAILHQIPGNARQILEEAGHEVVADPVGVDAVLSLLTDKIDSNFFEKVGPQLKIVANYAVGFDNIDAQEAKKRNIFVTNTPGGFETSVAEHAIGLMLSVNRQIVAGDKFVRAKEYQRWDPNIFLGHELSGQTLGIVGLGRIGTATATIAKKGFNMKINYFCRNKCEEVEKELGAVFYDDLLTMLAQCDYVSLHTPLNPQTRHMIGQKELSSMKKTAILINTARGAVVDELALAKALQENWIAGAGLDVFEDETSIVTESEKILYSLNNVVLTPHIGSATYEARNEMAKIAAYNILDALSGQTPKNVVTN